MVRKNRRSNRILRRVNKRLGVKEGKNVQNGGFSAHGSFGNVIHNTEQTVIHSIKFIGDTLKALEYAVEMPFDLYYHTGKSSQPTTSSISTNTSGGT